MPYLAFDFDALEEAPNVARAAHITEDAAIAGLLRTWRHCWRKRTDTVSGTALQGFFGQDARPALMEFGFVEANEDGAYRVRGAERYLRLRKVRSDNGKKAAAGGNLKQGNSMPEMVPNGLPVTSQQLPNNSPATAQQVPNKCPVLTASSEQRAAIEDLRPPPEFSAFVVGPKTVADKNPPPEPEAFEADADGIFEPTAWGFWGWHNLERQQKELHAEPTPPQELKEWHDRAVSKVGIEGLVRSYKRFLEDDAFTAPRFWPFKVFMSENVWLPRANTTPRKQVRL